MSHHDTYKVADTVPEGVSGNWKVERFTIGPVEYAQQQMRAFQNRGRMVPEGTYTQLLHHGQVIMSDTPDEIRDHYPIIHQARGRVLIGGLGIGMVTRAVLEKPEVSHVTVLELSPDVISLVAPAFYAKYGDRVTIIEANALEWKAPKGERWNAAWWDIWPNICSDNLEQMTLLHRRFGTKVDWQGSWAKELCLDQKRRWDKEKSRMGRFWP